MPVLRPYGPRDPIIILMNRMVRLNHAEIIALSEDPDVSFDDVRGQPPTAEERAWLADLADSLFYQCSLKEQIITVQELPAHISARPLARMSDQERSAILSRIPSDLAKEITALIPAGVP